MKYLFIIISSAALFLLSSCTVQTYTISFDSQGGSLVEPFLTSFIIHTELPKSNKEGYVFVGWSLTSTGNVITDLKTLEKNDYLLYAIWTPLIDTYTITWISEDDILDQVLLKAGETIDFIETPSKSGYTFSGWYLDFALLLPLDFTDMPNKDISLYAKFVLNNTNIWSFETIEDTETTLKLVLRISGVVEFIGFDAILTFDSSVIELISATSQLPIVKNQTSAMIRFNYVNALNKKTAETDVLEISFKKLSNDFLNIIFDVLEMITIDDLYNISNVDFSLIQYNED
jgi:uncharacterized repeat protein (TIGR02543 family)